MIHALRHFQKRRDDDGTVQEEELVTHFEGFRDISFTGTVEDGNCCLIYGTDSIRFETVSGSTMVESDI